ncbi:MAG TPA: hypothetical protein VM689_08180 [Aliidongia sp.]|nr:hypothetical protein [Aliidongia sp.]
MTSAFDVFGHGSAEARAECDESYRAWRRAWTCECRRHSDVWQWRSLRGYVAAKIGVPAPLMARGLDLDDLADGVPPEVLAAANAATGDALRDVLHARMPSPGVLRARLDALRQRGRDMLAQFPELHLDQAQPGPPRGLTLPDDDEAASEIDRVAPGLADGTAAQTAALMAAAVSGDLDMRQLPRHIVIRILAALEEEARRKGKAAGLPLAADPSSSPEAILREMLTSPELSAGASVLLAALTAARDIAGALVMPGLR